MAAIAPLPPTTPQQSFARMPTQASPSQYPSAYGNSYNMSFESQHSQGGPGYSQSFPNSQASFPNGPVSGVGYSRSFGDNSYAAPRSHEEKPQIYTAVYSGVSVYEMEIQGIACMRRRSDGWLNATQILKVAGVDKGKRTKVLEKEILTGEHEKVQGGYGKYQGTWISYKRGREFCRQYGVEDILRPLLEYDVSSDGSGGQGQQETPTKEQAMAANRKRFYNTAVESQRPNGGPVSHGTFFSNISPTTSVALAAMNKAARLNSPAPRPSGLRRPSQQDAFPGGSQQSMVSESNYSLDGKYDSAYSTQPNGEPPRKRMRPNSRDGAQVHGLPLDASIRSVTPTEPNESFYYDPAVSHEFSNGGNDPIASAPLPATATDEQQDKMGLILDLFAEAGRTDYSSHPALTQLSGEDLNIPLDASANNALHWAATLAKIPLLKLLIQKGANIYRGNAAGQSPLISAVLVNNCWEHSCFPELLDVLGPLIEVRDLQGKTILHHIAVSSGIKGRAPSSKYYLEALLEHLVRIGTHPASAAGTHSSQMVANVQLNGDGTANSSQESTGAPAATAPIVQSSKGPLSLVRFLSDIVNARDRVGNTALNLVARIGNQSIIKQLLEIHADPTLPNFKGVSAKDFGVGTDYSEQSAVNGGQASQQSTQGMPSTYPATQDIAMADGEVATGASGSQTEDIGQDVITSMTTMLTQSLTSHKDHIHARTEEIDLVNGQIREFSALQKQELERVQEMRERVRLRDERRAKIANLKRSIAEKRERRKASSSPPSTEETDPSWLDESSQALVAFYSPSDPDSPNAVQRQFVNDSLPSPRTLRAHLNAATVHTDNLKKQADELKSRSADVEAMYRKVVSLCTGVEEDKVEESLPALVAAVESEKGALGQQEVGRVRDFLRRVDGAAGPDVAVEG